jgi:hypothetical protein
MLATVVAVLAVSVAASLLTGRPRKANAA